MIPPTFQELRDRIHDLYFAGDYAQALELVDRERGRFPDQISLLCYYRACLTALLGDTDGALTSLQEGLDSGSWYAERDLRSDPDLANLQGLPEFEAVVALSRERNAQAQALVKPAMRVAEPVQKSKLLPALLVLHGNSSNIEETYPHWSPVAGLGWLAAVMQSTQLSRPDSYVWNDFNRSTCDLQAYFRQLNEQYPLDPDRVVVAGFSMGGGLAAWLALNGSLPVKGFFLFGPYLRDLDAIDPLISRAKSRGLRGYILAGDEDRECLPIARELHARLAQAGIPSRLEIVPGMKHEYPEDFERWLAQGLEFIGAGDKS